MTRAWGLAALLATVALAACGPDCDKYCNRIVECAQLATVPRNVDKAACILGCNDSSSGKGDTIQCYIDHSCSDINAGHCSVTGMAPK